MGAKSFGQRVAPVAYLVGALVCFATAIYSIILDRAASAGIAAAFCVTFLFLRQLPIIESFEVFTLKAKFTRRIDEFDQLLSHVRRSAQASSKLLYAHLGWMNRMGTMTWRRKRLYLTEIDEMLRSLNTDENSIIAAKRPFLNLLSLDLFRVFEGCLREVLQSEIQKLNALMSNLQTGGPLDAEKQAELDRLLSQRKKFFIPELELGDLAEEHALSDVGALSRPLIEEIPLDSASTARLQIIRKEVADIANECWQIGNVSERAERYLDKYGAKPRLRLAELAE